MKINGIAHIVLSVRDISSSIELYETLFTFLEFETVFKSATGAYFVGGRTAVGIMQASSDPAVDVYRQGAVGLHHFCLRANSRDDVDRFYAFLTTTKWKIIRAPEEGTWAPGYYSTLFEDFDGIRLEMNHVPGKGLLANDATFHPEGY